MKTKSVLVRKGQHMRPMLAVLERYGIGQIDTYGRGRWITERDIPIIRKQMDIDSSKITSAGRTLVKGSNLHNYVEVADYVQLFDQKG